MNNNLPNHEQGRHGELIGPDDLCSVTEFARRHPNICASEGSLRQLLRFRDENGLTACGAVIELRSRPGNRRCRLLVSPRALIAWARAAGRSRGQP